MRCKRKHIFLASLFLLVAVLSSCQLHVITVNKYAAASVDAELKHAKIIFLAGPDSHGEGEHQHQAGSELLSAALREQYRGFEAVNIYGGWPEDESIFIGTDALVFYCDGGRGHMINDRLDSFKRLLDKGVGVVALHYSLEVPKDSPSAEVMLRAIGGYFETHWSVNPFWEANYAFLPNHTISLKVQPFTQYDEWYFNMRFQPRGVTPILTAVPPESTMDRWNGAHSGNSEVRELVAKKLPQVTAWAYEREDGGRGFGYTGGHIHENWQEDHARQLVLNAIVWVTGN